MMWKTKRYKKYRISIETFPKTRKKVSETYKTGIRFRSSMDAKSCFITLGTFRIIISREKEMICGCPASRDGE